MIRSGVFTISRTQLVRIASSQYLRRMWPVFVAFPAFGLAALIFGPNQLVRAIGALALVWPFTIPARVIIASWNKAKRLMQPTWVGLENDVLYFHDDKGGGMQLPLSQVRRIDCRDAFYIFETRRFNFALIPFAAFEEKERARFDKAIGVGA